MGSQAEEREELAASIPMDDNTPAEQVVPLRRLLQTFHRNLHGIPVDNDRLKTANNTLPERLRRAWATMHKNKPHSY